MEDKEQEQLQDSILEDIMPALDAYILSKLKLQQFKQFGKRSLSIEQDLKNNILFHANEVQRIILQDAEKQQ
jgi:hypothetical protein